MTAQAPTDQMPTDQMPTDQSPTAATMSPPEVSARRPWSARSWLGAASLVRRWLVTGVGYMVPFVVTGGILLAAAFLLGGADVAAHVTGTSSGTGSLAGSLAGHGSSYAAALPALADPAGLLHRAGVAGVLYALGSAAMVLLVPALAGAVAAAVAGPLALVAGVVGGLLCAATGAGYLGGLLTGLVAGAVVLLLRRIPLPTALAGMSTVVLVPVLSTLAVGLAVLGVIGPPTAAVQQQVTGALTGLSSTHATVLGLVLGLLVAVDIGGPVNKTAYAFALATLAAGDAQPMAAVMAAGLTPPLATALASSVRPRLFSPELRGAGKAGWLLGASFVTEGAIPFAVADPMRVIPSVMAGSAVAGALSMTAHATSLAPHGGLWVLGVVGRPLEFLAAVAAGVLVSSGCLLALRRGRGRGGPRNSGVTA